MPHVFFPTTKNFTSIYWLFKQFIYHCLPFTPDSADRRDPASRYLILGCVQIDSTLDISFPSNVRYEFILSRRVLIHRLLLITKYSYPRLYLEQGTLAFHLVWIIYTKRPLWALYDYCFNCGQSFRSIARVPP